MWVVGHGKAQAVTVGLRALAGLHLTGSTQSSPFPSRRYKRSYCVNSLLEMGFDDATAQASAGLSLRTLLPHTCTAPCHYCTLALATLHAAAL